MKKNNIKRFFKPLSFRKKDYFKFFIRTFFEGINLVVHVLFLERITHFLEIKDINNFHNILIAYFIYILSFEIFYFITKKWGWMTTIPMGKADILKYYLIKYIKLDNNEVEKIGTGKLIGIIDKGSDEWIILITDIIIKGISLIISIIFTFYMVGKVKIMYALLFAILLVAFFFIGRYANSKLWDFRRNRYELKNRALRLLVKVLMSKIEILQNKKIKEETHKITQVSEKLAKINKDMSFYRTIANRTSQFTISIVLFLAFWFLGNKYLSGEFSLSELVGLTGTLIVMQKTIYETVRFYIDFTKKIVSVQKFWDFFDNTPFIKGYEKGKNFIYKNGDIQINNMSFLYGEGKKVFNNFNLNIKGGNVVALVGNSGSGKTTLVKLISGYLRHNFGEILIDKQNIKEIALKTFYPYIGYLTQEPSVFDGTIKENLMYGVVDKTNIEEKIENVIKLAKCEFIYDFKNGIDTEIGEKGIRLSGGQRQRLAIAKIFLKDPKIIILDEPTSALDSFSEEQITIAMENLFKNRTVIIIAHRLQTVKNADKIVVLENGEIKEKGTHNELIEKKGIYKKMLDLQSGF